jgi:pyruvate dehydrogenase E1 component alpha subunit
MIFPTYREHGVAWCRGMDPLVLMGLYRGTSVGGVMPREANFNMYTVVIGAQTLHAAGYAMGVLRDGAVGTGDPDRDTAVLAFFGDGASSQGDVNESFVWAAAENLPLVYVCQNNQWAISAPVTTQSRVPLYQRAAGFGFPGVRVDGNDVLACLAVTRRALDDARTGQGPFLIEAFTYRMGPHTSSDDPTRYRLGAEVETWKLKDPIARVRSYLTRHAGYGADYFDEVEAQAQELAEHLRDGTRALPEPTVADLFDHVYVDPPPDLLRQRAEFAESLAAVHG